MGFPKISSLVIGTLIVGVIVVALSAYWTNLAVDYGVTVNDAEFAKFNSSLNNIDNLTKEINNSYRGMEKIQDQGALEKIEGMAANFWSTIKLIFGSVVLVTDMAGTSIGLLGAGETGSVLRSAIIGIIIACVVFIGVYLIFKVKI